MGITDYIGTPLYYACINGHIDAIGLLVDYGADIEYKNSYKATVLHAVADGSNIDVLNALIYHGIDINAMPLYGWTPLTTASANGNIDMMKLLIDKGAIINVENYRQHIPITIASEYGHINAVRLLIEHGVDINARGPDDRVALQLAADNNHTNIIRLLISHGVSQYSLDQALIIQSIHTSIETVQLLLDHGAKVSSDGYKDMVNMDRYDLRVLKYLLKKTDIDGKYKHIVHRCLWDIDHRHHGRLWYRYEEALK